MPPRIIAKPLLAAAAIAALAGGFLSIYYISAKYFFNASNQALSGLYQQPLESGPNELKLSTQLSLPASAVSGRPVPESSVIPVWLPMLLFVCTLAGGWYLRWWYSRENHRSYGTEFSHSTEMSSSLSNASAVKENSKILLDGEKNSIVESSKLMDKIARRDQELATLNAQIDVLRSEYDLLETQNSDGAPPHSGDDLIQLKKDNKSQSEIIQTLEELLAENRENWLESDNTESVMRQEIAELTDNLNAAMAIIRAHKDTPGRSDASPPSLEPPGNETASN